MAPPFVTSPEKINLHLQCVQEHVHNLPHFHLAILTIPDANLCPITLDTPAAITELSVML